MNNECLKEIKERKCGYRNELFRDSGVEDFEEILRFEMFELGNEDIPDYLIECGMEDILKDIQVESFFDSTSEDEEYIVTSILEFINNKLGLAESCKLYAKWLASPEGVADNYIDGQDYEIRKYTIPDNFTFASDLGPEGCLVVSPNRFKEYEIVSTT